MLKRIAERNGHLGAIYDLKAAAGGFYSAAADGFIVHWHLEDVDFGCVVAKVDGGKFFSLETLPDGGLVAGALDGGVHWLYPGEPERNLHVAAHLRPVYDLRLVGEHLYSLGGDGTLIKWDLATRRTVESVQVSNNSLRSVDVYQKELLLIGASDGYVYCLKAETLEVTGKYPANAPSVFTLATLPGATPTHFVSGGRDARLLFSEFGLVKYPKIAPIDAHVATINDLAFSPNGKFLATVSRDKTVKLWSAENHSFNLLKVAEVVRDRGHVNSVNCLLWLNDETLITAGDDRRILEWRVG